MVRQNSPHYSGAFGKGFTCKLLACVYLQRPLLILLLALSHGRNSQRWNANVCSAGFDRNVLEQQEREEQERKERRDRKRDKRVHLLKSAFVFNILAADTCKIVG